MRMLLSIVLLVGSAFAQVSAPRPYIQGGAVISSEGYQSVGGNLGAGVDADEPHLIFIGEAFYDFLRKTNDNDQIPNEKGHVRTADGTVFFKTHKLLLGGGAGWDETSLTTYTKSAWTTRIGGGYDFDAFRLTVLYLRDENEVTRYPVPAQFTPGPGQNALSYTCSLCGNALQGFEIGGWYPSPTVKRHLFIHVAVTPVRFHDTVTDPYNLTLTQSQKAVHTISGSYYVNLLWRF